MTRKLPIFFHIPKCAGTYAYNTLFRVVKTYICPPLEIRSIIVTRGEYILYRLSCLPKANLNDNYKNPDDRWTYYVDYDDLNLDDLNLFFVEVCARSFNDYKNYIYNHLPEGVEPYEFIFLREPYSLAVSLYNYLNSDKSNHEPTNKSFNFNAFTDYLNSPRLQGSWLIHNLLNIPDPVPITRDHFNDICKVLDNMLVSDLTNVDSTILKVCKDCYGLDNIELNNVAKSRIKYNKNECGQDIFFDSLDEETKAHFLRHTKWDRELYNKYAKC